MSQTDETFSTSVGCMDGRSQGLIADYGNKKFNSLFVDAVTEAGLVGLLANNPTDELLESIKKKVLISAEKHNSKGVVVHGHQECAGNPVTDEKHKEDILKATEVIKKMVPNLEVVPVFVLRTDSGWEAREL